MFLELYNREVTPIYINTAQILYFHKQSDGNTYIQLTNNEYAVVLESPHQILSSIPLWKGGINVD